MFKKYINEMAIETGINDKNSYQGKTDWKFYQKPENKKYIKLYKKNIGSKHYKVYTTSGGSTVSVFLTTESDEYLGRIQVSDFGNKAEIHTSHGTIKDFYKIMFTVMLSMWDVILSDYSLSTQAIKSYEKPQLF